MKNKVCIVVPFRNREEHLIVFAPSMVKYLQENNTEGEILIVEQEEGKAFNRAKLLNVGFDYGQKNGEYTHYCFHDVDMIPTESDYNYCESPTHLAAKAQQFGYKLPYDNYFGGVTIFDTVSFLKINGYSNEYWGWGAEDDDVFTRCKIMGVSTNRKQGVYESLQHDRVITQDLYQQNVSRLHNMRNVFDGTKFIEGLSTLEYSLLAVEDTKNYKKIKVSI
jgi:predicted glycosyltransferase involved in capsule biosynthesis